MKRLTLLTSLLLILCISACRDEIEQASSSCNISSFQTNVDIDLSVTTIILDPFGQAKTSLDVENGDIARITAIWNKEALWNLKIIGITSRSSETFSGCGHMLNMDWDGINNEHAPYYNEDCVIELTFPENSEADVYRDTITISNTLDFNKQGVVVHTLDNPTPNDFIYVGTQAGTFITLDSALGGKYAMMNIIAERNIVNNPWLGVLRLRSNLSPPNFNLYYPITEFDPYKVYINFYVYTSGVPSRIYVSVNEELNEGYTANSDILSGAGWHLVSFKLSEMNFRSWWFTNAVPNLDQVRSITLAWVKAGGHILTGEHAFVAIDHIVFTYDNPLVTEP